MDIIGSTGGSRKRLTLAHSYLQYRRKTSTLSTGSPSQILLILRAFGLAHYNHHLGRKMQTRKSSMLEVAMNLVTGFIVSWVLTMLILPFYGFHVTGGDSFSMTMIFTVTSMIRSYTWRRIFNGIAVKQVSS